MSRETRHITKPHWTVWRGVWFVNDGHNEGCSTHFPNGQPQPVPALMLEAFGWYVVPNAHIR
jgi:hypothetical protein